MVICDDFADGAKGWNCLLRFRYRVTPAYVFVCDLGYVIFSGSMFRTFDGHPDWRIGESIQPGHRSRVDCRTVEFNWYMNVLMCVCFYLMGVGVNL